MKGPLKKEIKTLFSTKESFKQKKISIQDFSLPKPIQRYFTYALEDQQKKISYVRLKHKGVFRTNPKQDWKQINGQEYFNIRKPGFLWFGKVPLFSAIDKYINGKGNLKVKLFSLIKIIDEKGDKIDQSELLRFLGEAPWYPTALLPSKQVIWESIDTNSAKIIFTDHNMTVTGIFQVNSKGQIIRFQAKRYYQDALQKWTGTYTDYRSVNGINIPFSVKVTWNLPTGDYTYAKFDLNKIEYDNSNPYLK